MKRLRRRLQGSICYVPVLVLGLAQTVSGQAGYQGLNPQYQIANIEEDIRVLDERTRSLSLQIEQVTRENSELREKVDRVDELTASIVTVAELNRAVAEATRGYQSGDREMLLKVTKQVEQLAKQTQAAIDSLAEGVANRPLPRKPKVNFPSDYPPNGIMHTVQSGDTLSSIASRFDSNVGWIQNANKISEPRDLQVGQTLFIPQE
ncbi:MAG: peptidoglycan-binding protein [Verrucomicrobia bacterium]|nr:MAG: peptidoglycan-binding protein [Verrucomicrobiota bacterium]